MFCHQDEGAHRETENDSRKPTDANSMASSPHGSHVSLCALHWSPGLVFPCSVNRVELAGGGDVYKQDRLGEQGCAFSTHSPHQKMDCSLS